MTPLAERLVRSSDGIAVHAYLAHAPRDPHDPAPGHPGPTPVVWSHATGLHGRVFDTAIAALDALAPGRYASTTFDFRGHGNTPAPPDWDVDWDGYGDDAQCVARDARDRARAPVIGVGHSMGGAGLIMAALRDPSPFAALVVCEPILFPPEVRATPHGDNPLSAGARRRRTHFPSAREARANFAAKPPLAALDARVLTDYVAHGFAPVDPAEPDAAVELKCAPELEARTYEMGARHATWEALGRLVVPTWVVAGAVAPAQPSAFARRIAERIPGATYLEWADLGHFAPLEDPERLARLVHEVADAVAPRT